MGIWLKLKVNRDSLFIGVAKHIDLIEYGPGTSLWWTSHLSRTLRKTKVNMAESTARNCEETPVNLHFLDQARLEASSLNFWEIGANQSLPHPCLFSS